MAKVWTGTTSREVAGVGSVIDTHHEGSIIKRRTEVEARLDNFNPKTGKTPLDFFRELAEKARLRREGEREP